MNRRMEAAFRRSDRADRLTDSMTLILLVRDAIPLGDDKRIVCNALLGEKLARRDGWIALAGGDADGARALLVQARWFARTARRIAAQMAWAPAMAEART